MSFDSLPFLLFFVFVFAAMTSTGNRRARIAILIVASCVFYGANDPAHLVVLLGVGVACALTVRALNRPNQPPRRRAQLTGLFIVGAVSLLSGYKLAAPLQHLLQTLWGGASTLGNTSSALPLGISFYTFQAIGFVVDAYTRQFPAAPSGTSVLASLLFFPQLVAGPISRGDVLVPQLDQPRGPDWSMVRRAILLVSVGLLKKGVAEQISIPVPDAFDAKAPIDIWVAWTGTLAYAAQVYCDFSGLSDIAIGLACALGIRLPDNFNLPYLAKSPIEFWARWHISLSTWLRDYVYLPIATAGGKQRSLVALIATMVIGGFWHGAKWHYLVWGLYHGVLLVVTYALSILFQGKRGVTRAKTSKIGPAIRVTLTFYLILIGYVFFRAPTVHAAGGVLAGMHGFGPSAPSLNRFQVGGFAAIFFVLVASHALDLGVMRLRDVESKWRLVAWPIAITALALSFILLLPGKAFIYAGF